MRSLRPHAHTYHTVPLLTLEHLTVMFGNTVAVNSVNLQFTAGDIVSIVGPNGAGKTTLLRTIAGQLLPISGRVMLGELILTSLSTHVIAMAGVALCPEGRQLFEALTVLENLELGSWRRPVNLTQKVGQVCNVFPAINGLLSRRAGTLSGGEQQMVALARSMMAEPCVLLLDEPTVGLARPIIERFSAEIRRLAEGGTIVVIAEQNRENARMLSPREIELCVGQILDEGRSLE